MQKWSLLLRKYFISIGVLFNLILTISLFFSFYYIYSSGLSLPLFSEKVKEKLQVSQPNLYKVVTPILNALSYFEIENRYFRQVTPLKWSGVGANNSYVGKLITEKTALANSNQIIRVYSTTELIRALKIAQRGQTIMLAPGDYYITANRVNIGQSGTAAMPIHLTASELGSAKVFLKGEGVVVNKPYWQFSNLHIIGNCKSHSRCEHAFHVIGKGQHTAIRNNIMQDFNAMIKVNGLNEHYPDYGSVNHNTFFNTTARKTSNPVTPFDLMHANGWQVSDNFIYDIQKSVGDKVSYAAFFKGGSAHGIFERNLVICAANLPDKYTALGLSLGGGGSTKRDRRNQNSAEHVGGVIRNNIIMHCSNDVGIYINRSRESVVEQNILYNTLGIDIRYPESDAKVSHNIFSGRIKVRDKAKLINKNNIIAKRNFITGEDGLSSYFVSPEIGDFNWKKTAQTRLEVLPKSSVAVDFCGVLPKYQYIGAYSMTRFCLDKLNIPHKPNSEESG